MVQMRCTSVRWERPPLKRLLMDVTLRNTEGEPRWFVLPKTAGAKGGGVDGGEALELRDHGRVLLASFRGTGGFYALLLPPEAEVRLTGLSIAVWDDLPNGHISVRAVIARDVRIGGTPLGDWLAMDARCDRTAEAKVADCRSVVSKEMPGGKEQPVEYAEPRETAANVALPKEK